MNRKLLAELVSLAAKGAVPATAIASTMAAPLAQAASGDLDPAFASEGRLGPLFELTGPAWSVESPAEGGAILGGGALESYCGWYYCWYDEPFEASNFITALTEDGGLDAGYRPFEVTDVEVFDIARQADGKVIAAGRRVNARRADFNTLIVFRLHPDGALDAGFGNQGMVELDSEIFGVRNQANALLVEPDGRIAIAGARDESLIVLRLDASGALDGTFGSNGIFTGPAHDYDAGSRLARVSSGGYRVTTSDGISCRVLGLTAGGAVDVAFGDSGYAVVAAEQGGAIACHSIDAQSDDRLLVAGIAAAQPIAVRLLADGAPDPDFVAPDIASSMTEATAIAVADDGKILVAGNGVRGATVMRLQATGQLDALFGDAGSTTIDLPTDYGANPVIHDLDARPDGSVIAAGGDYAGFSARPFAVRLLGDAGGESAGVLSIVQPSLEAAESGEAVVTVRRTGGKSGAVSVAYEAITADGQAVNGEDYNLPADRLHWVDGDTSERSIVVPILSDAGPEEPESFAVRLSDAEGGAGLGTRNAAVTIPADGAPAGQFSIDLNASLVLEGGNIEAWINRNFYHEGAVCVTLSPKAGTAAAGEDFEADVLTACWADGEIDGKYVEVQVADDTQQEDDETLTVELSSPTGGAIVGPRGSATVTIVANDSPGSRSGSGGGGGAAGFLSLLMLGLFEMLRAARRRLRSVE
ncbi:MAG: Calx-beta domain-containing protein [Steroidobacteraceae bacterium]